MPTDDVLLGSPFAALPAPAVRPRLGHSVAVARCTALVVLCTGIIALLAAMEIETVMVCGPVLSLLALGGLALAVWRRAWRSAAMMLTVPVTALGCFLVIFVNRWSPGQAQQPIGWTIVAYAALACVPGGDAIRVALALRRPARWHQFTLWWMMGVLTSCAMILGMVRWASEGILPAVAAVVGALALPWWIGRGSHAAIGRWLGSGQGLLVGAAASNLSADVPQILRLDTVPRMLSVIAVAVIACLVDGMIMGRVAPPADRAVPPESVAGDGVALDGPSGGSP